MKINLHNIVCNVIERGLIEGYQTITSPKFEGDADDAIDCLFDSVMGNLSHVIDFADGDTDSKQPRESIGFSQVDAVSDTPVVASPDETEDEQESRHRYKYGRLAKK